MNVIPNSRRAKRLHHCLTELIYAALPRWAETDRKHAFEGWLSVQMLNAGIRDVWAAGSDIDNRVNEGTVVATVTYCQRTQPLLTYILTEATFKQ